MLRFVSPPDFESPADAGTDNLYQVTVGADDGDLTGTADVTVGVANVEEIGEVSMSSLQPQAGRALEASVSDPDGVVGTVSWSWQRSANLNSWSTITGETTAVYTPAAGDVGGCWTPRAGCRGPEAREGSAPPGVDPLRVTQQPEPVSPSYRNRVPKLSPSYRSQRVNYVPGQHSINFHGDSQSNNTNLDLEYLTSSEAIFWPGRGTPYGI